MKNNWQEMLRQYPDNSIARMCEGIIGLATAEWAADVKSFFAAHPVKQGSKQLEQHLEMGRKEWVKVYEGLSAQLGLIDTGILELGCRSE